MNIIPLDVRLPSVALDIAAEIESDERELERLLKLYVEYEEEWNERFKQVAAGDAGCLELARLQEERAACEANLGIEAIVDRAGCLREARTVLSDLVGMAVAKASREDIAAHAERFFGGGSGTAGPLGLEAWWLAGSLLDWVIRPVPGSDADIDIRITWRDLERMAMERNCLPEQASG